MRRVPPARNGGLDAELMAEVEAEPAWMYPWELAPGVVTPLLSDVLPRIHETRLEMLEKEVGWALGEAGPGASVLDLACNEGWFSHRMLELGASRVLGLDIREVNVRRAELVARRLGYSPEQLEFRQADVFELDPAEIGQFDVVLLLGLIYHVENPMGAIRIARACTRRLCVIEAQLTTQDEPIEWGMGPHRHQQPASFAAYIEPDANVNPVASAEGILSLIPNRAAVQEMGLAAGFGKVELCEPPDLADDVYIKGDRGQFLCWV